MAIADFPSTNSFVESGFWNFDTLFVPQQHPARDLQDTFYISDPPKADRPRDDETGEELTEYWDNVHEVHEKGKYGSLGYRYPWNEDEALRLVLRTHTTAISANMLHKLAKNPGAGTKRTHSPDQFEILLTLAISSQILLHRQSLP